MAVRDELRALAKLALMDDSARDLDKELKRIPQHVEELRGSVQTLEALLAQERSQLSEAEALKVERATELKTRVEGLQRARRNAAQATNMKESQAGEREVEVNRRAIKEREEDLKRIGETIEAKTASLAERENDFQEAQQMLQAEEDTSKTKIEELGAEREKLLAGREQLVDVISQTLIRRYERLRGPLITAVSIISDVTCPACRIAVPAQLFIEIQRSEEIHQCPNCRRIFIHKELAAD